LRNSSWSICARVAGCQARGNEKQDAREERELKKKVKPRPMSSVTEPPEVEREPATPIEYGRWAQRADRRHGTRDGRGRIPSLAEVNELLNAAGPAQMPTPYLEMLFSRARDMMEHERLWYIASSVSVRSELALLESQAAAARAALGPALTAREKAKTELTETDLLARHPAEELRSDVFIRLRREAEREQRIAAAEANYLRILADVHAVEVRLSQLRDAVQSRLSIARMRALRISAYLSARTATYWEALVHAHRDGRHLAPLLPHLIPRLPLWVVPEEEDSPDATPAPTGDLTGVPTPATSAPAMPAATSPTANSATVTQSTVGEPYAAATAPRDDDTKTQHAATDGPAHTTRPTGGADGNAQDQPVPAYRQ
jgi:hypothetical protein